MPDTAGMPITFGKILDNPDARAEGIEGMSSSPWDTVDWLSTAKSAQRVIEGSMAASGMSPFGEQLNLPPPLSPEEANARYGIPGALDFKDPVQDFVAQNIYNDKREELYRADAASRRPPGALSSLATFGANFVAQTSRSGQSRGELHPCGRRGALCVMAGERGRSRRRGRPRRRAGWGGCGARRRRASGARAAADRASAFAARRLRRVRCHARSRLWRAARRRPASGARPARRSGDGAIPPKRRGAYRRCGPGGA